MAKNSNMVNDEKTDDIAGLLRIISDLHIDVRIEGDVLILQYKRDAFSPELSEQITQHTKEIVARIKRKNFIRTHIANAMLETERKFPGRFDWANQSFEVMERVNALDQAMCDFISGAIELDGVGEVWRMYIKALDAQYELDQTFKLEY